MAVAYDTVGTGRSNTDAGGTYTHTNTGLLLYIILVVLIKGTGTLSASSYNSVALARLDSQAQSTNETLEVWGLKAPTTGSNLISYTLSGATAHLAQSFSFTGVDQTAPIGTTAKTSAAGGNPSGLTVNGAASGMFLTTVGGLIASTATLGCTTSGQVSRHDQERTADSIHLGVATVPGASSISDTWTWNVFADWSQIGVPLNASTAVGPPAGSLALGGVGV